MRGKYLAIIAILLITNNAIAAISTTPAPTPKKILLPANTFQEARKIFLDAVDRGELIVFGKVITRNQLEPVQVKYVYTASQAAPTIEVYSRTNITMQVPGVDNCLVDGIEAVLGEDGIIQSSVVHVRPQQQE